MANRNLKDSKIPVDWFYECWEYYIIKYCGPTDNSDKKGPIFTFAESTGVKARRYPLFIERPDMWSSEQISKKVKSIQTGPDQTVELTVSHKPEFWDPTDRPRLLIIQPNSHVDIIFSGTISVKVPSKIGPWLGLLNPVGMLMNANDGHININVDGKQGFVLRKGSILEDSDFKASKELEGVMECYATGAEMAGKLIIKQAKACGMDVTNVINTFIAEQAMFTAMTAVVPAWLLPADYAFSFMSKLLQAYLSYALSYCYSGGKEPLDLKNDLYVLFTEDVKSTLEEIISTVYKGAEIVTDIVSNEKLLTKLANSKLMKGLAKKVESKITAKGLSGAAKYVPFLSTAISMVRDSAELNKFATEAKTFYTWKYQKPVQKKVKVTFKANGGDEPSLSSKEVTVDSDYGTLPGVSRNLHEFGGWFTEASGGTRVRSDTKVTDSKNHNLYAHWTPYKGPTVTFDANGGSTPSPKVKPVSYGNAYGELPTVTRDKFRFDGWFTELNGKNKVESKNVFTGIKTLYAHWTPLIGTRITLDANGGIPLSPSDIAVSSGSKYGELPTASKPGYRFGGWYTLANGGSEVTSSTIFKGDNTTLYAHWAGIGITVVFNAMGGTPKPDSKSVATCYPYGDLPDVEKKGHKFEGWYTLADDNGTKIDRNTKVPYNSKHTLYAHWTAIKVKVYFETIGGSPDPLPQNVTFGSDYGRLPDVSKKGYKFGGWYTHASGGTKVESSTKVADASAHRLYARWTGGSITVSFNAKGGAPKIADKVFAVGSAFGKLPDVSKSGFKFEGWYTKEEGGNKAESSVIVSGTGKHTLYAHWTKIKPVSVKVTFEANGGKPSPAIKKVDAGSKYDTLPKVAKDGCKFEGWFTAAKSGTEVKSTTKAPEKDHTLYAHWTRNTVTVTFHRNGDGVTSAAIKAITTACNSKITLPKQPIRPGYTFASWNTRKDGSGTTFNEKTPVTADIEVFARWTKPKPTSVKVTFEADGGKPSPASKKVEAGSKYDTLPKVTKDRYEFKGWFTAAKSGTEVKSTTKAPEKDHTLYAHWTPPPPPPKPTPSNAHDSYCPSKVGMTLTYAHTSYGAYGGTTYSTQTVKDVKSSGNNMTVTLATSTLDKNRKPGSSHTHKQTVKNGVMVMDPNQMMAELQSGSAMDFKGEPIELPNDIKPGQSFKIPEINMTTDVGAEKVKGVMKFEGKCVAIEDVKVPAGTFKCRKISLKATATAMGMTTVMTSVMWEAPNIGHVKSEHHHDKIGLLSRSELVEIKGR